MSDQTVALTILAQMGGINRIRCMTGTKRFISYPDGVSFLFPQKNRKRPNRVKITLTPLDTYTVEFHRITRRGLDVQEMESFDNVYCDQLKDIFESVTGLYLSL